MSALTIAKLAASAQVNVETIRYYQRRGLLAEPARSLGAIRRYGPADVDQVLFIKRAQSVGFTLDEVQSLLQLRSQSCCKATRSLAASKLAVIEHRLEELQKLRAELGQWISACDANSTDDECPVIDRLEGH
jgi:MerR family transcriptional regulator, mercuric resistance operon regulatory protein